MTIRVISHNYIGTRFSLYKQFIVALIFTIPFNHAFAASTYLTITNTLLLLLFVLLLTKDKTKIESNIFLISYICVAFVTITAVLHIFQYGDFDFAKLLSLLYFFVLLLLWSLALRSANYDIFKISFLVSLVCISYGSILFFEYVLANHFGLHILDSLPRYSTGATVETSYFGFRSRGFSSEPSHVASLYSFLTIFSLIYIANKSSKKYKLLFFSATGLGYFSFFSTSGLITTFFSILIGIAFGTVFGTKLFKRLMIFFAFLSALWVIIIDTNYHSLLNMKVNSLVSPDLTRSDLRGTRIVNIFQDFIKNPFDYIFGKPFVYDDFGITSTLSSYFDIFIGYGIIGVLLLIFVLSLLLIRIFKIHHDLRWISLSMFAFVASSMIYSSLIFTTFGPFFFSLMIYSTYNLTKVSKIDI